MSSSLIDRQRTVRADWIRSCAFALVAASGTVEAAQVHPRVLEAASRDGSADVLLVLPEQSQPALAPLKAAADYRVRRRALIEALQGRAASTQGSTRAWLDAHGIAHRDFWLANAIQARVPRAALEALAARADVARIDPNPPIAMHLPEPSESVDSVSSATATDPAAGIGWGVAKIETPAVWDAGFDGQGVVIGGEDTGYQWDHPALEPQYRGWNGAKANHNYNWHDAIHDSSGNPCGNDSPAPCDDVGHGTQTAGTFAGDDGASATPRHQTGVAPGARWIGCRNMDRGVGTPARYIECMQWMLAPTNLQDANPRPDLAPDVISNSWACPQSEGCTTADVLRSAVDNIVAAGIFYAAAAQNSGPGCSTIGSPPATYDSSFDVGATDGNDALAMFSSRGPVGVDPLTRPDLSAPGVSICSSFPTSMYVCYFTGTSAAAPHVAGAVAVLLSAYPWLKGQPDKVAGILRATALTQGVTNTPGVTQSCGGTPITQWPNYMVGYGRLDVWNAYHEVIFENGFDG